jgi:hypothetical protein
MLVDVLKGNHLRVAATLPWLWVCLAIGQGRSQGVPGSMAGPGSPTITGSQVRGAQENPPQNETQTCSAQGGSKQVVPGGRNFWQASEHPGEGAPKRCKRRQRQSRWYRDKTGVGGASASSASDGCLRTGFSDPSRWWRWDGGGSASRHSIFLNKVGALCTLAAGFGSCRVTLSSVDAAAAGLEGTR